MFDLHLCHHPEDVCWCLLPDSERGGGIRLTNSSVTRINSPVAPFNILFYLQFLCLPSYFKQLCYGVHEPLEVMVAHLLNFPVMVPDPRIQLVHEEAMFVTVVHRAEKQK